MFIDEFLECGIGSGKVALVALRLREQKLRRSCGRRVRITRNDLLIILRFLRCGQRCGCSRITLLRIEGITRQPNKREDEQHERAYNFVSETEPENVRFDARISSRWRSRWHGGCRS